MRQLLLDFTQAPAPTFANFVPGGNAELAHALESAVRGEDFQGGDARGILALDDVERLSEARQIELFNAFNERAFTCLLVSASSAPRDLPLRRDLATRLATGLTYRVLPLSDAEKGTALAAHARVRGFALADEVIGYLLSHARRDMGSLMAALDALDRYSLETGRPITVPLLKSAMTA